MDINIGNYVACQLSFKGKTITLYGYISGIDGEKCKVYFFDNSETSAFHANYPNDIVVSTNSVKRTRARIGSIIRKSNICYKVVAYDTSNLEDKYYNYFFETISPDGGKPVAFCEKDVRFNLYDGNFDPLNMLAKFRESSPAWYLNRKAISNTLFQLKHTPKGFNDIIGARANIYPHQLDAIVKGLSQKVCRLMLADEAGLGKTIEACAILKGYASENVFFRAIIVTPKPLIDQWAQELRRRFKLKSSIYSRYDIPLEPGIYIVPFDLVENKDILIPGKFDFVVVDEAHKLLTKSHTYAYSRLLKLSEKTSNILLLSATPVIKQNEEYKKLLTLVNPNRFSEMSNELFKMLVYAQPKISNALNNLNIDIEDYCEYDIKDDIIQQLSKLNDDVLQDKVITNGIEIIQRTPDVHGSLIEIKKLILYIKTNYIFDDCIIRHRKKEILDASAKRCLTEIEYCPSGMAENYFEAESISGISAWFKSLLSVHADNKTITDCKRLYQATYSSPYAVMEASGIKKIPREIPGLPGEYFDMLEKWRNAFDWEVSNICNLKTNPELFHGRLSKVIKWAETQTKPNEKVLIYSSYESTAGKYICAFKAYFGDDSVAFFLKNMDKTELYEAVKKFQDTAECRFMICDSSGGEGSNFQMADSIIHTDLSWSPAEMEQRIGRLDRIGRDADKDVKSVVVHTDYGVDADLFSVYNRGLNIFNRSICGMEIFFDQIQEKIDSSFVSDPEHGLINTATEISAFSLEMDEAVSREMTISAVSQMDNYTSKYVERLTERFSQDDTIGLTAALKYWIESVGFKNIATTQKYYDSVDTMQIDLDSLNADISKENVFALTKREKNVHAIDATFSRDAAVRHEELHFIAPAENLFNDISRNALINPKGFANTIKVTGIGTKWRGFSIEIGIDYNYEPTARGGCRSEQLSRLDKFQPLNHTIVYISLPSMDVCSDSDFLRRMNTLDVNECCYLNLTDDEKKEVVSYIKNASVEAKRTANTYYNNSLNMEAIKKEIEEMYIELSEKRQPLSEYTELFLAGLEKPVIKIDSIAYIEME